MHVLIATDGSSVSIEAARRGTTLLGRPEKVTLLTVVSEIPGDDAGGFEGSVYSPEEQEAEWNAEMKEAADELARTAQTLTGAEVTKRVEVGGDVPSTICRIADEIAADVIVVGSHGISGIKRFFLGSVSEHVVRHAPCPVLVVRDANAD
jgi:nucleotide-binding universal stress UspA family protein